jgi:hypothetical protein
MWKKQLEDRIRNEGKNLQGDRSGLYLKGGLSENKYWEGCFI